MWRTEWKAIADRIQGLLDAGRFYLESQLVRREDPHNVADGELLPHIRKVVEALAKFHADSQALLPPTAVACLQRFIERSRRWDFTPGALSGLPAVQGFLTVLASFRSEFTYQISDSSAVAKRLSERAFTHLQRSIVADRSIRERWLKAFEAGETACEKLGGTHLLLHGIWAFKVNAEGERTDLVLGEPLRDLAEAERTAEALVLTEGVVNLLVPMPSPDIVVSRLSLALPLCGYRRARNLLPNLEALGQLLTVLGGGKPVTPRAEVLSDGTIRGKKALGVSR